MNDNKKLTKILLIIACCCLYGLPAPGAEDPWPLFSHSDHILHGTVVEIIEGERDRLYRITIDPGTGTVGQESWWLREPEGEGTEGIGALPGHRGAWLVAYHAGGEFPAADATVLPGGLFSIQDPSVLPALEQLMEPDVDPAIPLTLLGAIDATVRRIAIGWWRVRGPEPDARQFKVISNAFGQEVDTATQRSWLELFLQRGWRFEPTGLADLVPHSKDPAVSMLTLQYLKTHGTPRHFARLVSAWPAANAAAKKRLAVAYRNLGIEEASPWLLQGIASNDPSLRLHCIESLGLSEAAPCRSAIYSLLHSTSDEIRAAALCGLARSRHPGAWQLLDTTISNLAKSDPLLPLATALRKHPWKVLKTRGTH
ncbi:MAG: HEAT repeat domain-containing protein [Planctomycetota bacterium]|nr:HEAT repeat domain-containing protein [Planctomycetota bacterium]